MEQNTAEWLRMRKRYIGASDAPIIMGVNKFKMPNGKVKSIVDLWNEKLGLENLEYENGAMRFGKRMEGPARRLYEKMSGNFVTPEIVFHKDVPYMMASLDGLSPFHDIAVEIKTAKAADHDLARNKKIPEHYKPQVHHQLDCLYSLYKIDMMHYFSMHKGEGIIVEVKRDLDYLEKIYEEEKYFWDCVEDLCEPKKR